MSSPLLAVKLWAIPKHYPDHTILADYVYLCDPLQHGCSEFPQSAWDPYQLDLFGQALTDKVVAKYWPDIQTRTEAPSVDTNKGVFQSYQYEASIGLVALNRACLRGSLRHLYVPAFMDY